MIDWLRWLKRLEFASVTAMAIAGLCLLIGQSAERYADASLAAAARLAAHANAAGGGSAARFDDVDFSPTGAVRSQIPAGSPCKTQD